MQQATPSSNEAVVDDKAMEASLGSVVTALADTAYQRPVPDYAGRAHPEWSHALEAAGALDPYLFALYRGVSPRLALRTALGEEVARTPRLEFLFAESRFVECHLKQAYARFEGDACCTDKARWALRALARHLAKGAPIVVDLQQKYTFHLPTRVLNTQESLTEMLAALQRLHLGMPDAYFTAYARLV